MRHLQSPFSRSGSRTLGIPVIISPFYSFARLVFAAAEWLLSDGVAASAESD
jgi:hypothetical protein